jgi:hypothetical protein
MPILQIGIIAQTIWSHYYAMAKTTRRLAVPRCLSATSPLLDHNISATLYAESLVMREENQKASIDGLLGGHFPTVSILFGLVPIEYWTNATATSHVDEILFDTVEREMGSMENNPGQMRSRLTWKRQLSFSSETMQTSAPPLIRFTEADLAGILF